MNWYIILTPIVLVLLALLLISKIRKRKKKRWQIPQDVLEDFSEAERRIENEDGIDPQQILWDIRKRHGGIVIEEPGIGIQQLPSESERGEDIQSTAPVMLNTADTSPEPNRTGTKKALIARIRRGRKAQTQTA